MLFTDFYVDTFIGALKVEFIFFELWQFLFKQCSCIKTRIKSSTRKINIAPNLPILLFLNQFLKMRFLKVAQPLKPVFNSHVRIDFPKSTYILVFGMRFVLKKSRLNLIFNLVEVLISMTDARKF